MMSDIFKKIDTMKAMKKVISQHLLSFFALFCTFTVTAQVPAFPGAEGHGRYVKGGRGGKVIHVTNLDDSGPGSFRAAVYGSTKKIIVFDVAGVIALKSDLTIGDNTTIAGQTAPYPGITLRYRTVRPGANNIIRFIRIRRGQEKDVNDGADAIWQREKNGILIDHCSFSWCIDEVASFYDNNNFTMQWCTIAESLTNAGHNKGAHGYGGIWGGKLASFHHNFLLHMQNRTPRFNGARYQWSGYKNNSEYNTYQWDNYVQAEIVDFRNCVLYNWGTGGCYGGPGGGYINMVNNYYKAGPATKNKTRVTQVTVGASGNSTPNALIGMTSRYYINGNYVAAASTPENYDWKGVVYDNGTFTIDGERYSKDKNHMYGENVAYKQNSAGEDCVSIKVNEPTATGEVTTHSAKTAFRLVTNYAGASLYKDNVDERYYDEAINGTATYTGSVTGQPGIIDVVADVEGYTENNFGTGQRPAGFDSDEDGIADEWELANGLNPNDASDAALYTIDSDRQWYSNLEVYLNSLVEHIMQAGNCDAQSPVNEYYPAFNMPNSKISINVSNNGVRPGDKCGLIVDIQNGDTIINGYQFTIELPDGFTLAEKDGDYIYELSDRYSKKRNMQVNISRESSNVYKVICFSLTNEMILGPEGPVITLTLSASDNIEDNNIGRLTDIVLSTANGQGLTLADVEFNISKIKYALGDANGDGSVNVADVMLIVNHILGNTLPVFHAECVNMNSDSRIDVADVMLVVNMILSGEAQAPAVAQFETFGLEAVSTSGNTVDLRMNNMSDYTAFQMQVQMPANIRLIGVEMAGETTGHHVMTKEIGDGLYNVIVYSLIGENFKDASDGTLLRLMTSGSAKGLEIKNIQFTNRYFETITFSDVTGTTGIEDVSSDEKDGIYYNLQGMPVKSPNHGVYIKDGKKMTR